MRSLTHGAILLAITLSLCGQLDATTRLQDSKLEGQWKLVLLLGGDYEFYILTTEQKDGKLAATIDDEQRIVKGSTMTSITETNGAVTLTFQSSGQEITFKGTLVKDGDSAGQVLGNIRFRGRLYPARLEKTDAEKVSPPQRSPLSQQASIAGRESDPKARIKKLEELMEKYADNAASYYVYTRLLSSADAAELSVEKVREYYDKWISEAKPYGNDWVAEIRLKALTSLDGQKSQAKLALELASAIEKALGPDATTAQQAAIVKLLFKAAKLSGNEELAKTTLARSEKLELKLDEEFLAKVPPFKPQVFAGRENAEDNRVVLLELFTGAECPPCIAADVAFDSLLKSYKPSEMITLQYHLHIPGPDPLTNLQTVARAKYYGARSTPSTFFNGALQARGGGGMTRAKIKYDQYRQLINKGMDGKKLASITLAVRRKGNTIHISAAAKASTPSEVVKEKKDAKDNDKDKEPKDGPKLRLRLALTEDTIRYVGSNRLRFHHHVVRALPGGVEGTEFMDGKCKAEITVDLDEVRDNINEYLEKYGKAREFRHALPPIEFQGLSVVAFVQDDSDQNVLHTVISEVPDSE